MSFSSPGQRFCHISMSGISQTLSIVSQQWKIRYMYWNDFLKFTALIVLKYHVEHDKAARFQNYKIQPDGEPRKATIAKIAKKVNFVWTVRVA